MSKIRELRKIAQTRKLYDHEKDGYTVVIVLYRNESEVAVTTIVKILIASLEGS